VKLFPHILFEKHVYILALEMTKPRNNRCANCIGTLSFPMYRPLAFVHLLSLAFLVALTAPDPLDFDINFSHIITVAPRVEIQVGKGLNLLAPLDIK